MIIVEVMLLPFDTQEKLEELSEKIREKVAEICVISQILPPSLVFMFPPDLMKKGLGEELVVRITGTYPYLPRNDIIALRFAICYAVMEFGLVEIPNLQKVVGIFFISNAPEHIPDHGYEVIVFNP